MPFAELLLPVALKLFPNMLPSTYEGQKSRENKATSLRATRKDVSSFLRQTLRETGLPVSAANAQRDEFTEFFRKVSLATLPRLNRHKFSTDLPCRFVLLVSHQPRPMSSVCARFSRTTSPSTTFPDLS